MPTYYYGQPRKTLMDTLFFDPLYAMFDFMKHPLSLLAGVLALLIIASLPVCRPLPATLSDFPFSKVVELHTDHYEPVMKNIFDHNLGDEMIEVGLGIRTATNRFNRSVAVDMRIIESLQNAEATSEVILTKLWKLERDALMTSWTSMIFVPREIWALKFPFYFAPSDTPASIFKAALAATRKDLDRFTSRAETTTDALFELEGKIKQVHKLARIEDEAELIKDYPVMSVMSAPRQPVGRRRDLAKVLSIRSHFHTTSRVVIVLNALTHLSKELKHLEKRVALMEEPTIPVEMQVEAIRKHVRKLVNLVQETTTLPASLFNDTW